MSNARKTQAKYGAQIPAAHKPGPKAAQPAGNPGGSAKAPAPASQGVKGGKKEKE